MDFPSKGAAALALSLVAFAPLANAEGLSLKDTPKIAPFNWTGFYVGLNAGRGWSDTDVSDIESPALDALSEFANIDGDGVIGGIHAGYNWRAASNWVFGLEVDFGWSGIDGSATAPNRNLAGTVLPGGVQWTQDLEWLATVRGRIGYLLAPTWLGYVTGGLSIGDFNYSASHTYNTPPSATTSFSSTQTGYNLGVGTELVISGNWLLRVEYMYHRLDGDERLADPPFVDPFLVNFEWDTTTIQVVRAGLSYKF